jgi:hypothetical protein
MKLYGVTESQAQAVMAKVSRKLYKGNLEFAYLEPHANHVQFTLRVRDSHGKGARTGMTGRHMISACWHAHRDLMREIFAQYPQARLVSAQAVYNDAADFQQKYQATGYRNIGSMMQPLTYEQACEC